MQYNIRKVYIFSEQNVAEGFFFCFFQITRLSLKIVFSRDFR